MVVYVIKQDADTTAVYNAAARTTAHVGNSSARDTVRGAGRCVGVV